MEKERERERKGERERVRESLDGQDNGAKIEDRNMKK